MFLANSIAQQPEAAEAFVAPPPAAVCASSNQLELGLSSCRAQLDRVVEQIESPKVRRIIGAVFQDLTRLLECLAIIERHLRHVNTAEESIAFFQLIHDEARSLVEFIRSDALNCAGMPEHLADTLDGITFALNHDLRRVFETENREAGDKAAYVVLSRVHRAHDVLTNCLQQSTVSLAVVFDRELVGAKLFNNSDRRYRQSLQLCHDLSTLRGLVDNFADTGDQRELSQLIGGLYQFRNESMECLMYSDWPQFESFCDRIQVAGADLRSLEPVLHQFQCYLETLLGQVKMRAVLADSSSVSFSEDNNHLAEALLNDDQSLGTDSSATNEEEVWSSFAFAV